MRSCVSALVWMGTWLGLCPSAGAQVVEPLPPAPQMPQHHTRSVTGRNPFMKRIPAVPRVIQQTPVQRAVDQHRPVASQARIQKAPEPVVNSQQELDAVIAACAARAQNPINLRLDGTLKSRWRQLISSASWGEYARHCSTSFLETGQVSLTLEYRDYVRLRAALRDASFRSTLSAAEQRVLQELERRIRSVLRPGMNDFEKVLAVHDYLVQTVRYDANGSGKITDILSKNCGSCEAYSATLCVMLELARIPCRVVTGNAGGPHAWNLVQVGSQWYHVDATWDDPVISGGRSQVVSHTYFCTSDAEMSRTHRWNRQIYPVSGTVQAYYYRQRGIYFSDFASFWRAAMAAYRRGESRFEGYLVNFGNNSQFQKNIHRYSSMGTPSKVSWTGPDGAAGPVIVSF